MATKELDIDKIIDDLVNEIKEINNPSELHLHERYLHHRFSYLVQKKAGYEIVLDNQKSKFHPEWATAIVGTRKGGYYRRTNHGYEVRHEPKKSRTEPDGGTPGFIDFAVGDFNFPICAIEFKMAKSLDSRGYVFDYMKLLDGRNKIEKAISLSVVYERNAPIEPKDLNDILGKATTELKSHDCLSEDRPFRFIVIQRIGQQSYVWECSSEDHDMKFREIKQ